MFGCSAISGATHFWGFGGEECVWKFIIWLRNEYGVWPHVAVTPNGTWPVLGITGVAGLSDSRNLFY